MGAQQRRRGVSRPLPPHLHLLRCVLVVCSFSLLGGAQAGGDGGTACPDRPDTAVCTTGLPRAATHPCTAAAWAQRRACIASCDVQLRFYPVAVGTDTDPHTDPAFAFAACAAACDVGTPFTPTAADMQGTGITVVHNHTAPYGCHGRDYPSALAAQDGAASGGAVGSEASSPPFQTSPSTYVVVREGGGCDAVEKAARAQAAGAAGLVVVAAGTGDSLVSALHRRCEVTTPSAAARSIAIPVLTMPAQYGDIIEDAARAGVALAVRPHLESACSTTEDAATRAQLMTMKTTGVCPAVALAGACTAAPEVPDRLCARCDAALMLLSQTGVEGQAGGREARGAEAGSGRGRGSGGAGAGSGRGRGSGGAGAGSGRGHGSGDAGAGDSGGAGSSQAWPGEVKPSAVCLWAPWYHPRWLGGGDPQAVAAAGASGTDEGSPPLTAEVKATYLQVDTTRDAGVFGCGVDDLRESAGGYVVAHPPRGCTMYTMARRAQAAGVLGVVFLAADGPVPAPSAVHLDVNVVEGPAGLVTIPVYVVAAGDRSVVHAHFSERGVTVGGGRRGRAAVYSLQTVLVVADATLITPAAFPRRGIASLLPEAVLASQSLIREPASVPQLNTSLSSRVVSDGDPGAGLEPADDDKYVRDAVATMLLCLLALAAIVIVMALYDGGGDAAVDADANSPDAADNAVAAAASSPGGPTAVTDKSADARGERPPPATLWSFRRVMGACFAVGCLAVAAAGYGMVVRWAEASNASMRDYSTSVTTTAREDVGRLVYPPAAMALAANAQRVAYRIAFELAGAAGVLERTARVWSAPAAAPASWAVFLGAHEATAAMLRELQAAAHHDHEITATASLRPGVYSSTTVSAGARQHAGATLVSERTTPAAFAVLTGGAGGDAVGGHAPRKARSADAGELLAAVDASTEGLTAVRGTATGAAVTVASRGSFTTPEVWRTVCRGIACGAASSSSSPNAVTPHDTDNTSSCAIDPKHPPTSRDVWLRVSPQTPPFGCAAAVAAWPYDVAPGSLALVRRDAGGATSPLTAAQNSTAQDGLAVEGEIFLKSYATSLVVPLCTGSPPTCLGGAVETAVTFDAVARELTDTFFTHRRGIVAGNPNAVKVVIYDRDTGVLLLDSHSQHLRYGESYSVGGVYVPAVRRVALAEGPQLLHRALWAHLQKVARSDGVGMRGGAGVGFDMVTGTRPAGSHIEAFDELALGLGWLDLTALCVMPKGSRTRSASAPLFEPVAPWIADSSASRSIVTLQAASHPCAATATAAAAACAAVLAPSLIPFIPVVGVGYVLEPTYRVEPVPGTSPRDADDDESRYFGTTTFAASERAGGTGGATPSGTGDAGHACLASWDHRLRAKRCIHRPAIARSSFTVFAAVQPADAQVVEKAQSDGDAMVISDGGANFALRASGAFTVTGGRLGCGVPAPATLFPSGEYTTIAATVDVHHRVCRVYVNGRLHATAMLDMSYVYAPTTEPVVVGAGFVGKIAGLSVATDALGEAEVGAMHRRWEMAAGAACARGARAGATAPECAVLGGSENGSSSEGSLVEALVDRPLRDEANECLSLTRNIMDCTQPFRVYRTPFRAEQQKAKPWFMHRASLDVAPRPSRAVRGLAQYHIAVMKTREELLSGIEKKVARYAADLNAHEAHVRDKRRYSVPAVAAVCVVLVAVLVCCYLRLHGAVQREVHGVLDTASKVGRMVNTSFTAGEHEANGISDVAALDAACRRMGERLVSWVPHVPHALTVGTSTVADAGGEVPGRVTNVAAIAVVGVEDYAALTGRYPREMRHVVQTVNDMVRACAAEYVGREVAGSGSGTLTIAFATPGAACVFAIDMQRRMAAEDLHVERPSLRPLPANARARGAARTAEPLASQEARARANFHRVRLEIGVAYGTIAVTSDPFAQTHHYTGWPMEHARRLANVAHGGTVALSGRVLREVLACGQRGSPVPDTAGSDDGRGQDASDFNSVIRGGMDGVDDAESRAAESPAHSGGRAGGGRYHTLARRTAKERAAVRSMVYTSHVLSYAVEAMELVSTLSAAALSVRAMGDAFGDGGGGLAGGSGGGNAHTGGTQRRGFNAGVNFGVNTNVAQHESRLCLLVPGIPAEVARIAYVTDALLCCAEDLHRAHELKGSGMVRVEALCGDPTFTDAVLGTGQARGGGPVANPLMYLGGDRGGAAAVPVSDDASVKLLPAPKSIAVSFEVGVVLSKHVTCAVAKAQIEARTVSRQNTTRSFDAVLSLLMHAVDRTDGTILCMGPDALLVGWNLPTPTQGYIDLALRFPRLVTTLLDEGGMATESPRRSSMLCPAGPGGVVIGVSSGSVLAGTVGNGGQQHTTAVGACVNLCDHLTRAAGALGTLALYGTGVALSALTPAQRGILRPVDTWHIPAIDMRICVLQIRTFGAFRGPRFTMDVQHGSRSFNSAHGARLGDMGNEWGWSAAYYEAFTNGKLVDIAGHSEEDPVLSQVLHMMETGSHLVEEMRLQI